MSSRREQERLGRLAGTGKGSGGGLPLPDLFSAILNELLDNGPASSERLTGIAASALEYKSNNVMTTWGSWGALAGDVLEQMASREIVSHDDDGLWHLGGKFGTGVPLVIIPAGKGRKPDGVTIWLKDEREQLGKADHAEREALSMVGRYRPVDNQRVSAIRQSEPEVGQLYPVLVDQNGRLLDGAHRREANPKWRTHTIRVDSEEMALAVGLWANSGQPLPAKVRARITELIGDLSGSNQIKRDRIKAALLQDASPSDREVARTIGVDHKTIAKVRTELEVAGEIPQQPKATNQYGESRKPRLSRGKADDDLRLRQLCDENISTGCPTQREIAEMTGWSMGTVQRIWTARKALAQPSGPFVTGAEEVEQGLDDDPVSGEFYAGPWMPQPPPVQQEPEEACSHEWVCRICGELQA